MFAARRMMNSCMLVLSIKIVTVITLIAPFTFLCMCEFLSIITNYNMHSRILVSNALYTNLSAT